ncbi:MAG: c-type cytochrome [Hydrogenophilaceae bacterium]
MNIRPYTVAALSALTLLAQTALAAGPATDHKLLERGKYLTQVGGCNDCHTPGYPESGGKTPTQQWLTGSSVGFQGPWGTSYPTNLRLRLRDLSEAQWLARAHQPMRPPMPWFNLAAMTDQDLVAMYRFIRNLGPAGAPAPSAAAPGVAVATPYIEFVPKNLPVAAKHAQR